MSSSIAQNIALCQEAGYRTRAGHRSDERGRARRRQKQFRSGEDITVDWNADTGIELSASKVVVDDVTNPATELSIDEARELAGDEVEIGDALLLPLPMEELGRIAAQTAKQILFQKVRDAVRSNVYEQYIDKIGDLVNGYVKRERGNIIDLGNLEAILPGHNTRGEQWNQGERIRAVINNVSGTKDRRSKSHGLRRNCFAIVRAGSAGNLRRHRRIVLRPRARRARKNCCYLERARRRSGRSLRRHEGSRVQAIIRELRSERSISSSGQMSLRSCANALSPAKVNGSHYRHREPPDGSDRQRRSTLTGDWQTWSKCPAGYQTRRLEYRYPQRGRTEAGNHRADGRADRFGRVSAAFGHRRRYAPTG